MRLQSSQLRSDASHRGSNLANNASASLNNSASLHDNRSTSFIDSCTSAFKKTTGSFKKGSNRKSASQSRGFGLESNSSVNVGASTSRMSNSQNFKASGQKSTRKKLTKHNLGSKPSKNSLMQKYKLSDYKTSSKTNASRGRMGSKSSVSIQKSESQR